MDPLLIVTHITAAVGGWLICWAQLRRAGDTLGAMTTEPNRDEVY